MKRRSLFCLTFVVTFALLLAAGWPGTPCTPLIVEGSIPPVEEHMTPVLASVLSPPVPVELTDGKVHLVYDLLVTNALQADWTLEKLDVFDIDAPDAPLTSFAGEDLKAIMQVVGPWEMGDTLGPGQLGVIYLELTVPSEHTPTALRHEFHCSSSAFGSGNSDAESDTRVLQLASTKVAGAPVVIGPPLNGSGWVAANVLGSWAHRRAIAPVNSRWYIAQRFAVDWMQADQEGYMVRGVATANESFVYFGADLLAVEDGIVAAAVDGRPEQVPGKLPEDLPASEAGGNQIILDIGDDFYATYAHVKTGSLRVSEGDRVTKGQVIGQVGNSGHSSAPHLHFHVTEGLSPLIFGASGVPFVFSELKLQGQVVSAESLGNALYNGMTLDIATPADAVGSRSGQMPANFAVVDFTP